MRLTAINYANFDSTQTEMTKNDVINILEREVDKLLVELILLLFHSGAGWWRDHDAKSTEQTRTQALVMQPDR